MYSVFTNLRKNISLEKACEKFNVEEPKYLHKNGVDPELTMNLVRKMCKQLDYSLEKLIELCDSCSEKNDVNQLSYDDFERNQPKRNEESSCISNNNISKTFF